MNAKTPRPPSRKDKEFFLGGLGVNSSLSAVQNKRTGEPPRRQERQGLFFNTILRGLGCKCFLLGAPVGRSAKPVGANAPELFFAGPRRNIMIYLAVLGALGVLAV
ncbi:MAG TPA: hypothetical protein VM658_18840, partial [bacterium]|nr:hypothetical protein [bacterium]